MTWGQQNSEADAHAQLDLAESSGINFIDTAEMYAVPARPETQGRTESYIGSWLAKRKDREQLVVASKVSGPGPMVAHIRGGPRLNAEHITRACEDSLQRLRTDYIDLYQVHWPARQTNCFGQLGFAIPDSQAATPIVETLKAITALVEQGKVRYVGISNETPWGLMQYLQLAESLDLARCVSIQNPYNLFNRSFEIGLAEIAWRERVGLLAYSPLAFGVLTGKYRNGAAPPGARVTLFPQYQRYSGELADRATEAYQQVATQFGLTLTELALGFVNSQRFLTSTIIGATSLAQLREDIAAASANLDDAILSAIEAVYREVGNPCP